MNDNSRDGKTFAPFSSNDPDERRPEREGEERGEKNSSFATVGRSVVVPSVAQRVETWIN